MSKEATIRRATIKVSVETWRNLNGEKLPGESFDRVIGRILATKAQGAN